MKSLESDIQDQSRQSKPEARHPSSDQTCQHGPNILRQGPPAQTGQPQTGHSVANRAVSDQTSKLRQPWAQTKHQNPDCTCQLRPDISVQTGPLQTRFSSSGTRHFNSDQTLHSRPRQRRTSSDYACQPRLGNFKLDLQAQTAQSQPQARHAGCFRPRHPSSD